MGRRLFVRPRRWSKSPSCPFRGAVVGRGFGRSSKTVRPPWTGTSSRSCAIVDATSASGCRRASIAADERVEPARAIELVCTARALAASSARRSTRDRLVVDLQRHREWVAVLAAVREGEARRVVESCRRAVHDFGDQRQRLQRARAQLFEQQERGEVAQIAFVRERQHGAQPLRVDVGRVAPRGAPASRACAPRPSVVAGSVRRSRAAPPAPARRGDRPGSDRAGGFADDGGMRLGCEVATRRRMPVIAPRQAARLVHSLLDHRPCRRRPRRTNACR